MGWSVVRRFRRGRIPDSTTRPIASRPPHFLSLGFSTLLMVTGMTMLVPATHLLRTEYQITNAQVGVVIGMFSIGRLMFDLPGGRFSDRWGFKRVARIGIVISAFGAIGAANADSFQWLLVARAIQGIGSALYTTAAFSLVISLSPAGRIGWLVSLYQGILLIGLALGPVLGGFVAEAYGLAGCFYAYAIMGALAIIFLAVVRTPADSSHDREMDGPDQKPLKDVRLLLRVPALRLALLVTYSNFWVRAGVRNTLLPLFMAAEMKVDGVAIGLVTGSVALANIATLLHLRKALDRHGRRRYVVWGTAATAGAIAFFVPVTDSWMLVPTAIVLGAATGYAGIAPAAMVADLAPPRSRGTAMGLHRTAIDLGFLTGPVLIGLLIDVFGHRGSFVMAAILLGLVLVAIRSLPETMQRPPVNG